MKGSVSRDFIVFLPILTVRWYFLVRYFFVKSIKIGPLISHIFRITNHRSLFLLKTSIYIQIVIRWASIHRLSICIIDLPTTANKYEPNNFLKSNMGNKNCRIQCWFWIRWKSSKTIILKKRFQRNREEKMKFLLLLLCRWFRFAQLAKGKKSRP